MELCVSVAFHAHHLSSSDARFTRPQTVPTQLLSSANYNIPQIGPGTDTAAYASLLRHCITENSLSQGELVHQHIIRHGHAHNRLLTNLLVRMYGKCGSLQHARAVFNNTAYRDLHTWNIMLAACAQNESLDDARALFAEMPERDVVSWNAIITACAQNGQGKEALLFYGQMHANGFEPNTITFICILDACASIMALEEGREIHASIVCNGWETDIVVGNAQVNMYGKCGKLDDARAVFVGMPQRNVISWNAMIAACAQNRSSKEALRLFNQMQAESFQPDRITFISMVAACASMTALEEGRDVHANVVGNGVESDVVMGTALVNMYGRCGRLDDARSVFTEMPRRNVVSWNAMITVCMHNERDKDALELFHQMQAKCFVPNMITFICILDACANVAALEEGQQIHATIVGNRWESVVTVGNALVNMYGKCGSLNDARAVFAEMPQRNVVSFSAMMTVCTQNGHGKEALQLFGQMQAEGIEPDDITFVCVLSACSQLGLVDEGRRYFMSMSQDHGILPSVNHHLCMIVLLGQAGQLDKAEQLINSFPVEPAASAWLSLLSSCRIHGDLERGIRAANHVFGLHENHASPYVLLANIHAAADRQDDVEM